MKVELSVVVPAHDEAAVIGATLARLFAACAAVERELGMGSEVVVVDDSSSDGTAAIAARHGARVVPVELRRVSAVRNAGARAAQGRFLVFVDADTQVPDATLVAAARAMAEGAVGGGARMRFDRPIPLWGVALETIAVPVYRVMKFASGCFTFASRPAFEAVGGYDEGLAGGEEALLGRMLAKRGRFVVLREHVLTSGRKMRTHGAKGLVPLLVRLVLLPRSTMRDPARWDMLYGARRTDPARARAEKNEERP
ncbi:MAG: glycosyltransferase [Planctomycetota bacterium]